MTSPPDELLSGDGGRFGGGLGEFFLVGEGCAGVKALDGGAATASALVAEPFFTGLEGDDVGVAARTTGAGKGGDGLGGEEMGFGLATDVDGDKAGRAFPLLEDEDARGLFGEGGRNDARYLVEELWA